MEESPELKNKFFGRVSDFLRNVFRMAIKAGACSARWHCVLHLRGSVPIYGRLNVPLRSGKLTGGRGHPSFLSRKAREPGNVGKINPQAPQPACNHKQGKMEM